MKQDNTLSNFDAYSYFAGLVKRNKLMVEHKFAFTRISNYFFMQEIGTAIRSNTALLALSDTTDGKVIRRNGTCYRLRVFTVHLFKKCNMGNMDDFAENMELCRTIMHQIIAKMIKDSSEYKHDLDYLNKESFPFIEYDKQVINNYSGLRFMISVDEPINVCYKKDNWL